MVSLGCPKNLVDSEVFANLIEKAGYQLTNFYEQAEIIIVNTCGFILPAKEESIETILTLAEYKKSGNCKKLIVTGCLVKRYFNDLKKELPEIDHLIDLKDFAEFARLFSLENSAKRKLLTPSHYAFLRISDGCNNYCSYCTIPKIRGNFKSRSIDALISEAQQLAEDGVKEIIVTSQDTSLYGIDIYKKQKLPELLKKLHKIEGIKWIRLLYLHPAHLKKEIVNTMIELPKVCNYFDIPFQHIDDEILASMNRKITKKEIIELIDSIWYKQPDAVIRSSFIVGYPGETEEKFLQLKNFLKEYELDKVGVFAFSREEGTKANDMENQVDNNIASARRDILMQQQQAISEKKLEKFIDRTREVIIEKDENGDLIGRTEYDAPEIDGIVYLENQKNLKPGIYRRVKIIDTMEYDLLGRVL